ncbi:MAG: hypothetical protein PVH91_09070, partial [Pseudomonadales bacterium]
MQKPGIMLLILVLLAAGGCGSRDATVRFYAADQYPKSLLDWGVVRLEGEKLTLGNGVQPYDLNTPLFTD